MSIKNLFKKSVDAVKKRKDKGKAWKFVANPKCCDKCRDMDNMVRYGSKPTLDQDEKGRYGYPHPHCKCHWEKL